MVEIDNSYDLTATLDEYEVWLADVKPHLSDLRPDALEIWQICFTEMFNNAIDHSGGKRVLTTITRSEGRTRILIIDDGVGIFRKIQAAFNLVDERHAVLELTKGKITTDPSKHSGQGIFMASRLLDDFKILSGGVFFSHKSGSDYDWISESIEGENGTAVGMELADDTKRTAEEVAVACSSSDGLDLAKTLVPVTLAREGNDNLVSRSQAKRLLARLDRFQTVVLDFEGVDKIGQAFADEIFRVFAKEHPGIILIPVNANDQIIRMITNVPTAVNKLRMSLRSDAADDKPAPPPDAKGEDS